VIRSQPGGTGQQVVQWFRHGNPNSRATITRWMSDVPE
jgi:hypothetical protein